MADNIKYLFEDSVGDAIVEISNQYHAGNIQGMIVGIVSKDGTVLTQFSGELSFIEKLGVAQTIILDANEIAQGRV